VASRLTLPARGCYHRVVTDVAGPPPHKTQISPRVAVVAADDTKPRHLELPDYIRILSKRKWFILIVTAVAALVGGLYAVSSERVYEATALVLVRQRPQGFFWITGEDASMAPNVAMETHARIVRGTDVTGLAAGRLAELPAGSRIITTATEIQSTLSVSVIRPDLLRIDATSPEKQKARYFANYVAQAFVKVNTDERQEESFKAVEFLDEQVAQHRDTWDEIIQEMAQLGRESGFVDVETQVAAIVSDLRTYENQLRQAETDRRAAEARLQQLERTRAGEAEVLVSTQPVPNPGRASLQERLNAARIDLHTLTAQYTDGHPKVLNARALVHELEDELARVPELVDAPLVVRNPAVVNIEADLKAARVDVDEAGARYAAIDGVLAALRDEVRGLPEEQQRWRALIDRGEAARRAFLSLQEELRQAKLAAAIKGGNARVVDMAETAREIKASLGRSLVFAGALGLFVGLALAILLEAMDDTVYSVEDLQRVTDLYLLGVIPLRTDEAGALVTMTVPKSPPAEAYRTLRSNIRFSLFDKPARTFLITSAGTGEGKSVTAANLAIAYAQSGESVILVDTDLRRPILHRLFDVAGEMGTTNVLVGDAEIEDVLQETDVPGLRVLPSGPLPPNPAELLESEQMTQFTDRLAELADLVIFDSPPAVMLTDAGLLSSKIDRTILVAESGQVTERAIRDMERLFRHARADVLGVVLNKLRVTGGDYYYYYYYYYYDYASRSAQAEEENGRLLDELANGTGPQEFTDLGVRSADDEPDESPAQDLSDLNAPEAEDDGGSPHDLLDADSTAPDDLSGLSFPDTDDDAPQEPSDE